MNSLPQRQSREVLTVAGDSDGQNTASKLGAILTGLAALPEQQTIQPATWRDVLARGGADGLNGADGSGNDPEMMQDYLDRINGEEQ